MDLDGIRKLGEHGLAADLELVIPYTNEHLGLEGVGEYVWVALDLREKEKKKLRKKAPAEELNELVLYSSILVREISTFIKERDDVAHALPRAVPIGCA